MKITLKNYPEEVKMPGLFGKKKTVYRVSCYIEFTEEEQAVIKTAKLMNMAVETTTFQSDKLNNPIVWQTTFKDLIEGKPLSGGYSTPVEANNYEHQLKTDTLPHIKAYLEGSRGSDTPKSETFEL